MHLQLKQTSQVCAQVYLFIITVWLAIHQEKECPWSAPPAILDVGELQIVLLECAMEYELKVFFYKDSSHYRLHTNTESLAIYMRDYSNKVTCSK
jgi:hypothetical protein